MYHNLNLLSINILMNQKCYGLNNYKQTCKIEHQKKAGHGLYLKTFISIIRINQNNSQNHLNQIVLIQYQLSKFKQNTSYCMSNNQSFQEILLADEKPDFIKNLSIEHSKSIYENSIDSGQQELPNRTSEEISHFTQLSTNSVKHTLNEENLKKQNYENIKPFGQDLLIQEEMAEKILPQNSQPENNSPLIGTNTSERDFENVISKKIYTRILETVEECRRPKEENGLQIKYQNLGISEVNLLRPELADKKFVKKPEYVIPCQRGRQKAEGNLKIKEPKQIKKAQKIVEILPQQQKPQNQEFISQTKSRFEYFFTQCRSQAKRFLCPKGHEAKNVCVSKQCDQIANICAQSNCQHRQRHKNCILALPIQMFVDQLNKNLERQREIAFQLFFFQEKIIKNIENNRIKLARLLSYQGIGTQQYEQAVKKESLSQISLKGSNVLTTIDQFYCQKKYDTNRLEFIKKQLNKEKKRVDQILQSTANIVLKKYNKEQLIKIPSNLVSNKQEIKFVLEQLNFPKEIKLLYRASENEFSLPKYHKLCSNVEHTLTIIKTEHQKLIGGYTPVKLNTKLGRDRNNKTFLMAISLKEKLEHIHNGQSAIHYDKQLGPCFGGLYEQRDIEVFQQNGLTLCHTNFPSTYNWKKHFLPSQESWRFLTGAPEGKTCRVMDFEVFKVYFRE